MPPARLGCSPKSAPIAGGAAEPVAGGQPVSIVQNISYDLLDGEAEPHCTSLVTPATGPAASSSTCYVQ
eukprot:5049551-Prymnesium_polylepis.1